MMKKIISVLSAILIIISLFACAVSVSAAEDKQYIHDESGVLTQSELDQAKTMLTEASEKYGVDIVIFLVPEDVTDEEAEALYDDNGYGTGSKRDGIITVIITDDSVMYTTVISLAGRLSEKGSVSDAIDEFPYSYKEDVANKNYLSAISKCVEAESRYIEKFNEENGFHPVKKVLISLAIGLAVGGITVLVMKSKLKSVGRQRAAASYVIPGSFNLVESRDLFLYSNVTRTERSSETRSGGGGGSHTSSGGVSHSTGRF